MTNKARKKILQNIQRALNRTELSVGQQQTLRETIYYSKKNNEFITGNLQMLFTEKATKAHAIVNTCSLTSVPSYILQILKNEKLPFIIRAASDLPIHWRDYPELRVHEGKALISDAVSVTSSLCGVAETGTLVLLSSRASPSTLYFLPIIHIILLDKQKIVPYYEDAIEMVRELHLDPRMIHFITGPSRTADIEQSLQIGMHGPKQLYVLLI